ncbi:MAG: HipA domain-containing protein [Gammaproteobacteria bacterium]|nr:HipA domain-containing protein [Gammaproteobacteria bacterium]
MGVLTVTDQASRFTYETGYERTGLRGLGLIYPPDQFPGTIVRDRSAYFDLHPPLQSLVPPRSERNFQRALLLKYLESKNIMTAPGFDTDWAMLTLSGHGGIGHLDVFDSDEAALQWYGTPAKKGLVELDDRFGFSLKEFMIWFDDDAKTIIDILGPTPSVGGAIPKLALSIDRNGWDGRIGLPTRFGDTDRTDILLKLENTSSYPGIIELEVLGLEIHRAAGFEVPRFWPVEINGLRALAIERFDRTEAGRPVFMESIYSILASGRKLITHHYSASYDLIGKALDNPRVQLVADRKAAKLYLLERLILALLTGNGDLHLENLSIIDTSAGLAFSPVYDPVPMRAYSLHNMLFPPGMSFGDYGDIPEGSKMDEPVGFKAAFIRFNKSLGISKKVYLNSVQRLMAITLGYPDRINKLKTVPDENKQNLIKIHKDIRQRFDSVYE